MTSSTRRRTYAALSGLSVAVALTACTSDGGDDQSAGAADTSQEGAGQSDAGTGGSTTTGTDYADGTYTAEGSYSSPGGQQTIGVELTVADGAVSAVTVTPHATDGNAQRFQQEFASGIADEVVGRDLADLQVDKVSGSSLTGGGFNAALDEIRADASA